MKNVLKDPGGDTSSSDAVGTLSGRCGAFPDSIFFFFIQSHVNSFPWTSCPGCIRVSGRNENIAVDGTQTATFPGFPGLEHLNSEVLRTAASLVSLQTKILKYKCSKGVNLVYTILLESNQLSMSYLEIFLQYLRNIFKTNRNFEDKSVMCVCQKQH